METAESIAGMLAPFAWPLTVVGLVIFASLRFKGAVEQLINRITRIETPVGTLAVGAMEELRLTQGQGDQIERVTINELTSDTIRNYPRAAVIEAWHSLEWTANRILEGRDTTLLSERTPWGLIRALRSAGLIEGHLYDILSELRTIRNQAARNSPSEVDSEFAREYVARAEMARSEIEAVADEHFC